jgi:hypothetical protein
MAIDLLEPKLTFRALSDEDEDDDALVDTDTDKDDDDDADDDDDSASVNDDPAVEMGGEDQE